MVILSKQNKIYLLILLILINILIRYPKTTHEIGVDGFFIHSLASTISTFDSAKWILNPLSFFGLYPMSYASAGPFLLSGISQTTGIDIEMIILLIGIILGLFSMFSMFLLANLVFKNEVLSYLVAFIYSLSPFFVEFGSWQMSTRVIFIGFFPILIWSILKIRNSLNISYIPTILILLLFLLATHRIALFMPLIFFAYFMTILLRKIFLFALLKHKELLNIHLFYISIIIILFLFYLTFFALNTIFSSQTDYQSGYFFKGTDPSAMILNLGADLIGKIGILFVFIFIGLYTLISKLSKLSHNELFIILAIIFTIPLLKFEDYVHALLLPFFSLIIGLGIFKFYSRVKERKRVSNIIISGCLIISVIFSIFLLNYWYFEKYEIDKEYSAAKFIEVRSNNTIIANEGLLAAKISSFSGKPTLPFGGAYAIRYTPEQLAYGFANKTNVKVQPLKVSGFLKEYSFYGIVEAPDQESDWESIMNMDYQDEKAHYLMEKYNARLIISKNPSYEYWGKRNSRFLSSIYNYGNNIYDNGITIHTI